MTLAFLPQSQCHEIADALIHKDWVALADGVPLSLVAELCLEAEQKYQQGLMTPAAVGRGTGRQVQPHTRSDLSAWFDNSSPAQNRFCEGLVRLQETLNRCFFLGLQEHEAHFACFPKDGFYRRHLDSFKGNNVRRITIVSYLNENWSAEDGGAIRLYNGNEVITDILPYGGTLLIFLSEAIPHEVLPAHRSRYSVAAWLRTAPTT